MWPWSIVPGEPENNTRLTTQNLFYYYYCYYYFGDGEVGEVRGKGWFFVLDILTFRRFGMGWKWHAVLSCKNVDWFYLRYDDFGERYGRLFWWLGYQKWDCFDVIWLQNEWWNNNAKKALLSGQFEIEITVRIIRILHASGCDNVWHRNPEQPVPLLQTRHTWWNFVPFLGISSGIIWMTHLLHVAVITILNVTYYASETSRTGPYSVQVIIYFYQFFIWIFCCWGPRSASIRHIYVQYTEKLYE